jgi:hypothetical protein
MSNKVLGDHHSIQQHLRASRRDGEPIKQHSRQVERRDGGPLYSHPMEPPRHETNPAFSAPIAPGPDEGKKLQHGPGWTESRRHKTPVQNNPTGKNDRREVNRGKSVTY